MGESKALLPVRIQPQGDTMTNKEHKSVVTVVAAHTDSERQAAARADKPRLVSISQDSEKTASTGNSHRLLRNLRGA